MSADVKVSPGYLLSVFFVIYITVNLVALPFFWNPYHCLTTMNQKNKIAVDCFLTILTILTDLRTSDTHEREKKVKDGNTRVYT